MMHHFPHLENWLSLPEKSRERIFSETARKYPLPSSTAVEKDWWTVHTLGLIFSMSCAGSLVFKGGTSLSKGWKLIERYSEDIDLALDREYLGFSGELSKGDIRRLRRKSYTYITKSFLVELRKKFQDFGFDNVRVKHREVINHDQDPLIIEIYYPKLTETDAYLKPGLLIEVGSRSLREPYSNRKFGTFVSDVFPDAGFTDSHISVPTVNPERTFLEKIFLLHEEFQKTPEKIRVDRLSRHLYDIEKLSDTLFAETALNDISLYNTIVQHRNKFTPISGIDYTNHHHSKIRIIPPDYVITS